MAGPRTRQKLQPRNPDVLGNLSNRYYKERNLEGMKRMGQELQDRLQSHPSLHPGTGRILDTSPIEGGPIDPRSFWNVGLQSGDNSGIMQTADASSIFNLYDQWKDKFGEFDFGDKEYSYDYERPLGPGTLGIGGSYDFDDENAGISLNYSMSFNRGGIASL